MQDHSIQTLRPSRRVLLQSLMCGAATGFSGLPCLALGQEADAEIDFSYAGYGAGQAIPAVGAVFRLSPSGGDDTLAINDALETLASRARR